MRSIPVAAPQDEVVGSLTENDCGLQRAAESSVSHLCHRIAIVSDVMESFLAISTFFTFALTSRF